LIKQTRRFGTEGKGKRGANPRAPGAASARDRMTMARARSSSAQRVLPREAWRPARSASAVARRRPAPGGEAGVDRVETTESRREMAPSRLPASTRSSTSSVQRGAFITLVRAGAGGDRRGMGDQTRGINVKSRQFIPI
jgi:hypothetical protein